MDHSKIRKYVDIVINGVLFDIIYVTLCKTLNNSAVTSERPNEELQEKSKKAASALFSTYIYV